MNELKLFYPINYQNLLPAPSQVHLHESLKIRRQNKRAVKRGLVGSLTLSEWLAILDAYEWCCAYCRGPYESMDHVVAISEGGGTVKDNVLPSCNRCNNIREHVGKWRWVARAYEMVIVDGEAKGMRL